MDEIIRPQLDLDHLYADIRRTAELVEVPYRDEVVRPVVEVYAPRFQDSVVAFRTTNHPVEQRDLSIRYVNLTLPEDDPYTRGVEHGLLQPDDHPVYRLYADVREHFSMMGNGVDISARNGMEKIWPFFSPAVSIADAYNLPSLPESVRRYDDYFKKYNLDKLSLFAIDYRHKTMNVYFVFLPPTPDAPHALETIRGMIADLDFQVPSQAELEVDRGNVMLYLTFSWDSPRCLRASFVIPHDTVDKFPAHLDPDFFEPLIAQVPTLTEPTIAGMQTAYTWDKRNYLKIEVDYTGTMVPALRRAVLGA